MADNIKIKWRAEPQDQHYPAAASYLSLIYGELAVAKYIKRLRKASLSEFEAKDIFRASGLSLLGVSNAHVEQYRKKILSRQALSPLLLVRSARSDAVIIADGYHRLCAVYSFDEYAVIPCKIA